MLRQFAQFCYHLLSIFRISPINKDLCPSLPWNFLQCGQVMMADHNNCLHSVMRSSMQDYGRDKGPFIRGTRVIFRPPMSGLDRPRTFQGDSVSSRSELVESDNFLPLPHLIFGLLHLPSWFFWSRLPLPLFPYYRVYASGSSLF